MYENVNEAFKQLKQNKYKPYAESLAAYRDALLEAGFSRTEALEVLKLHTKYIYDRAYESYSLGDMFTQDELSKDDFEGDDPSTP